MAIAINKLADAIVKTSSYNPVLSAINNLHRKVDTFMATQEERLQAISTKIDEVLADIASLKVNNPQIEDELTAIENKLSLAQPNPTEPTGPTEPTA